MPWFKVDDGFHGHPKVVGLSLEAVGLWVLAGTWCANYLTDGAINLPTITRLGGREEHAAELVTSGLWLQTEDGYLFKDWTEFQPTKEAVEAERAAARERMQRNRAQKKGVRANIAGTADELRENEDGTSEEVRITPAQSQSLSQSHPSPAVEPPPFCERHMPAGPGEEKCYGCMNARKAQEYWRSQHTPETRALDTLQLGARLGNEHTNPIARLRSRECETHPGYPDTDILPCARCARDNEMKELEEIAH